MKKLMIAAAIVCAAVVANAAQVNWQVSNVYQYGTETKASGYTAYFFSTTDMYAADETTKLATGVARADVISALEQGKTDFLSNAMVSKVLSNGSGTVNGTKSAANGQTWTGYAVIIDSKSEYAYVTDTASKATGSTGAAALVQITSNTGTQTKSNWYAIPEPTSGLLLLLGMAGLALRRRRA